MEVRVFKEPPNIQSLDTRAAIFLLRFSCQDLLWTRPPCAGSTEESTGRGPRKGSSTGWVWRQQEDQPCIGDVEVGPLLIGVSCVSGFPRLLQNKLTQKSLRQTKLKAPSSRTLRGRVQNRVREPFPAKEMAPHKGSQTSCQIPSLKVRDPAFLWLVCKRAS